MDNRIQQIDQYLDGNLNTNEIEELFAWLAESPQNADVFARQSLLNQHLTELLNGGFVQPLEVSETEQDTAAPYVISSSSSALQRFRITRNHRLISSIAAVIIIILSVTVSFFFAKTERKIATITGLSGALKWTGDQGRVSYDLSLGKELLGGTIESKAPDSWFEFEFNDGSTVTISGISTLTFSEYGQKNLYIKEGKIFVNAKPQPTGNPMLIYTQTAMLEVVGTQFEVETEAASTILNVNEGKVRIKRISDNITVDVPAKHRIVTADDRDMQPVPIPESVSRWKSQFQFETEKLYGEWLPETTDKAARLRAIPTTIHKGFTCYMAACEVSRGDKPPVVLQPYSRLKVKGYIASSNNVYFGVTVRYPSGGFAGRFGIIQPATKFHSKESFEVLLDLQDFQLDPTLDEIRDNLPEISSYLVLDSIWYHTLDKQAGLEIIEMELLPPVISEYPAKIEPSQRPITNIWAAASNGDLEAIKQNLLAGIDIDTVFMAPGIIASGATSLHMAVLSDQREVSQFLIDQGANINAKAKDEYGGTPLHWAAAFGRVEIARQLINAGAKVNVIDEKGYTPLDATTLELFSESKNRLAIAEFLREAGGQSGDNKTN
ncbi:MAG: ankyrin repeat domain-containing protein [Phycisphaerae bacterium]|nr:ankyrin repeat domain-containing protein [Phycisphaerae bacterium]